LRSGVATEVHSLWNASGLIVTPERMEVSPVKDLKQIFCMNLFAKEERAFLLHNYED
jgi:hypothetical protein